MAAEFQRFTQQEAEAERSGGNGKKKWMIALIAFCAVLAVGIGVFLWIYSRDDGLIFDNVYALGIDLSGMTQEEAAQALAERRKNSTPNR